LILFKNFQNVGGKLFQTFTTGSLKKSFFSRVRVAVVYRQLEAVTTGRHRQIVFEDQATQTDLGNTLEPPLVK